MSSLIYFALIILCLGLVTSMSLLGGFHALIVIPCLYFIPKTNFKALPKSAWALMVFSIIIILSVLVNQDVALIGYKALGKVKYFLFGFFAIAPFVYFSKQEDLSKKIKILIYALLVSTTVATIAGVVAMKTGYNYISLRAVATDRNAGLSGMILNYAHNLAFFQIIVFGLIVYGKEVQKYVNRNVLIAVFIINFWGLYLTYTRGAILALAAGMPFFLLRKYKFKFISWGTIFILCVLNLYLAFGSSFYRPGSDVLRVSLWKAAYHAFEERPLTGYGYLNFEQHSKAIKKRYDLDEKHYGGHGHNNFLEIMASTGIFGLVSLLVWLTLWFVEMYKRDDLVARITLPFIIVFIVGGLTQATIALGVNLFFVMSVYSISQVGGSRKVIKTEAEA